MGERVAIPGYYRDDAERWEYLGQVFIAIGKHMAVCRMIMVAFCIREAFSDDPDRSKVREFLRALGPFDDDGLSARNLASAYDPLDR